MNRPESAKIKLLTSGVAVDPEVVREVTQAGKLPLVVNEYATTGGISLAIGGDAFYVNAPVRQTPVLADNVVLRRSGQGCTISIGDERFDARVIPLPAYLNRIDSGGRRVSDSVFTSGDRIRLSPITGCSMSCSFCDLTGQQYLRHSVEQMLEAMNVATEEGGVRHVLISGGTPSRKDYEYFDFVCAQICELSDMPVEVMMPTRVSDPWFVDRLIDAGVSGFAINLETSGTGVSSLLTKQKSSLGRGAYEHAIRRAVDRLGRVGGVRSLIVVGLEAPEQSLEAVEWLASLGCDPVLSPFRPAIGTPLEGHAPCSEQMLISVFEHAMRLVARYGVALGPRCVTCQNNVMAPIA